MPRAEGVSIQTTYGSCVRGLWQALFKASWSSSSYQLIKAMVKMVKSSVISTFSLLVMFCVCTSSVSASQEDTSTAIMDKAIHAYITKHMIAEASRSRIGGGPMRGSRFSLHGADHFLTKYPHEPFYIIEMNAMKNELSVNAKYPNGALIGGRVNRLLSSQGSPAIILDSNNSTEDDALEGMLLLFDKSWLEHLAALGKGDRVAVICKDFAFNKPLEGILISANCVPAGAHLSDLVDINAAKPVKDSAVCLMEPWRWTSQADVPENAARKIEDDPLIKDVGEALRRWMNSPDVMVSLLEPVFYKYGDAQKARDFHEKLSQASSASYLFQGEIQGWNTHHPVAELIKPAYHDEVKTLNLLKSACDA